MANRSWVAFRNLSVVVGMIAAICSCRSPVQGGDPETASCRLAFHLAALSSASASSRLLLGTATTLKVSLSSADGAVSLVRTAAVGGASTVSVDFGVLAVGEYTASASAYVDEATPLFAQSSVFTLRAAGDPVVLNLVPQGAYAGGSATDQLLEYLPLSNGASYSWCLPAGARVLDSGAILTSGAAAGIHVFVQDAAGRTLGSSSGSSITPFTGTPNAGVSWVTLYNDSGSGRNLQVGAAPFMASVLAGTEAGQAVSAFSAGVYEVTQLQFLAVMGFNPSVSVSMDSPVTNVTLYDCLEFCNRLSAGLGLVPVYTLGSPAYSGSSISSAAVSADFTKNGYRLPLHSERVRAARGGASTLYYWGDAIGNIADNAWVSDNASSGVQAVGTKPANGYGLYDMAGNAAERGWGTDSPCFPTYDAAYGGSVAYSAAASATVAASSSRTAYTGPGSGANDLGFRVYRGTPTGSTQLGFIATSSQIQCYRLDPVDGSHISLSGTALPAAVTIMGVAAAPDGRFVYVSDSGASKVHAYAVDRSTGGLTLLGSYGVGGAPERMAVDAGGKFLFVTEHAGGAYCCPIASDGTLGASKFCSTGSGVPLGLAVDAAAAHVYLANYSYPASDPALDVFDVAADGTLSSKAGYPINGSDGSANSLALSADGAYLYLSEYNGRMHSYKVEADGGLTSVSTLVGGGWQNGVFPDATGRFLYFIYGGLNLIDLDGAGGMTYPGGTTNVADGDQASCDFDFYLRFWKKGPYAFGWRSGSILATVHQDQTTGALDSVVDDAGVSPAAENSAIAVVEY